MFYFILLFYYILKLFYFSPPHFNKLNYFIFILFGFSYFLILLFYHFILLFFFPWVKIYLPGLESGSRSLGYHGSSSHLERRSATPILPYILPGLLLWVILMNTF